MIQEEFVTFETAKMLKTAGFPQTDDYKAYDSFGILYDSLWAVGSESYVAPYQSQAMRWLREAQNLFIHILCNDAYGDGVCGYNWQLVEMISFMSRDFKCPAYGDEDVKSAILRDPEQEYLDRGLNPYESRQYTYEAAAEAGIQAACRYLIKQKEA